MNTSEIFVLKVMDYDLKFFNAYDYVDFFFHIGIFQKNEVEKINTHILEKINFQAVYILRNFTATLTSLLFSDLQIACSIIKILREISSLKRNWPEIFQEIFYIQEQDFYQCYEELKM